MAEKKASLTVLGGPLAGTRFVLEGVGSEMVIGADTSCPFQLALAGVSAYHARIRSDAAAYTIEDAGSEHGLHVNDSRVTDAVPLRNGDIVWLGTPGEADVVMLQCILPSRPAAAPVPPPAPEPETSLSEDETLALALAAEAARASPDGPLEAGGHRASTPPTRPPPPRARLSPRPPRMRLSRPPAKASWWWPRTRRWPRPCPSPSTPRLLRLRPPTSRTTPASRPSSSTKRTRPRW